MNRTTRSFSEEDSNRELNVLIIIEIKANEGKDEDLRNDENETEAEEERRFRIEFVIS